MRVAVVLREEDVEREELLLLAEAAGLRLEDVLPLEALMLLPEFLEVLILLPVLFEADILLFELFDALILLPEFFDALILLPDFFDAEAVVLPEDEAGFDAVVLLPVREAVAVAVRGEFALDELFEDFAVVERFAEPDALLAERAEAAAPVTVFLVFCFVEVAII